jgi:hypothetical protein
VLALVFTFGSPYPGGQAIVLTSLCVVFEVLHLAFRPLRSQESQTLQTILLLCLALLALSGTPFTDALERGSPPSGSSLQPEDAPVKTYPSDWLARQMQLAFGFVVPFIALVWSYLGAWLTDAAQLLVAPCWRRSSQKSV